MLARPDGPRVTPWPRIGVATAPRALGASLDPLKLLPQEVDETRRADEAPGRTSSGSCSTSSMRCAREPRRKRDGAPRGGHHRGGRGRDPRQACGGRGRGADAVPPLGAVARGPNEVCDRARAARRSSRRAPPRRDGRHHGLIPSARCRRDSPLRPDRRGTRQGWRLRRPGSRLVRCRPYRRLLCQRGRAPCLRSGRRTPPRRASSVHFPVGARARPADLPEIVVCRVGARLRGARRGSRLGKGPLPPAADGIYYHSSPPGSPKGSARRGSGRTAR